MNLAGVALGLWLWCAGAFAGEVSVVEWVGHDETELSSALGALGAAKAEVKGERTTRHFAGKGLSVEFGPNPTEASMLEALGYTEGAAPPVVERVVFHLKDAGFAAWAGPLPGGIVTGATRAELVTRLGAPASASADVATWKVGGRSVTVRFTDGAITRVELAR
jgi:hypothetical protein